MRQQTEIKKVEDLAPGDRVIMRRGVIKTIVRTAQLHSENSGELTYDIHFADDSMSGGHSGDAVWKVLAPHDGQSTAPVERKRRPRKPKEEPAPEQPAKRTRRSAAQIEREAYERGVQAGIERAAKLAALNGEFDKALTELEDSMGANGMSAPGALARAFAMGQSYAKAKLALDNA